MVAFAVAGVSCALAFPDYEIDTASSSGSGGGAATQSSSESTSSALFLDGAPCSTDDECLNGNCLESNTGDDKVCCVIACPDMGPASCATNGNCDAQGGSCAFYPSGTICGQTASCVDGMLTSMQCQLGSCEHVLSACEGHFVCADPTSCKMECVTEADCTHPDAECDMGLCVHPDGAECESHDQCVSGVCGTTGTGHCCSKVCDGAGDECGPTDCDTEGFCDFPATPCGGDPSCMGATLSSQYCDEMGSCGRLREERPCPDNLLCDDALSCYETCGSNDSTGDALCTQGNWCDGVTCVGARGISGFCNRGTQCLTGICITIFGRCL